MTIKSRRDRVLLGLLVLATVLSYALSLRSDFLFDDGPNLVQNPLIQIEGHQFDEWRTAAVSSDAGPLGRPVAMLSFAASYTLAGELSPELFRAGNLLVHLLTALLVYWLALGVFSSPVFSGKPIIDKKWSAAIVALIWLIHPLHVSTVLYIVQRMAQLSALFSVLGLALYVHYRLRWAQRGASPGEVVAAFLWLAMISTFATLSKENGALLPWLLAVVELSLFRGRWCGDTNIIVLWLGRLAFTLPILLLLSVYLYAPDALISGYQHRDFTLLERLMTQSRILWHYLSWLIFPDITAMGFQHDDIVLSRTLTDPVSTLVSLVSWLAVLATAFVLRHRYPLLLFGLLFFLVGHAMESTFLALEMVFEHRNYLPSVGVSIFLGWMLTAIVPRIIGSVDKRLPIAGFLGILLVSLALRCHTWSDNVTLSRLNVLHHPQSSRAHYFYGYALLGEYQRLQESDEIASGGKAVMLEARQQFLRMHEEAPSDIAALVMLHYVDSYFFPGLLQQFDWLSKVEQSLQSRALQASDFAALTLLLDCVVAGPCSVSATRVVEILDSQIERNPTEVRLQLIKYEYLAAIDATSAQRSAALAHAIELAPAHASVQYYAVVEAGRRGDVGGMYSLVKNWLANDPDRRDLLIIKALFEHVENAP